MGSMAKDPTFYFYDLETSGFSPSDARIMQFAGQRTDLQLKPIGEPHNMLLRLSDDILPDPDAILITGITPQQTRAEGLTEAEFLKLFVSEIATPGTIFVGFNSIRFDDEFMRFLHYRNFYDAYEWQWQDGRSKWDLLDLVRMTRALRPEGIKWPVDSEGKPANRLTLLTSVNGLDHENAHDALSDVQASIALANLLRTKQPRLFDYLLTMRTKQKVSELTMGGQPYVYTSGKYPSEFEKTTVVSTIMKHPKQQGVLVFDLRHDPKKFADYTPEQLAEAWRWHKPEEKVDALPVKTMKFNHCPAIAPLSVLDESSKQRLGLDMKVIEKNQRTLQTMPDFANRLLQALDLMDKKQQARLFADERSVDSQLYDGFIADSDKRLMAKLHEATPDEFEILAKNFQDDRLKQLLPLYKARNFPSRLSDEERAVWEKFIQEKLLIGEEKSKLAQYFARIEQLKQQSSTTEKQQHLLTDLELYGQSLLPSY